MEGKLILVRVLNLMRVLVKIENSNMLIEGKMVSRYENYTILSSN